MQHLLTKKSIVHTLDFVKYKMLIYNRKDKIYAIEGKQTGPWSRGHSQPHGGAAKYKLAAAKGYFRIHDCCEFF